MNKNIIIPFIAVIVIFVSMQIAITVDCMDDGGDVGLFSCSPKIGAIRDFYYDEITIETGKNVLIPIEHYSDGIPNNLRVGIIGAEIADARYEFIANNMEKQPSGITAKINNTQENPVIIIKAEKTAVGEHIIGLIIVNDDKGLKELHQYQIQVVDKSS